MNTHASEDNLCGVLRDTAPTKEVTNCSDFNHSTPQKQEWKRAGSWEKADLLALHAAGEPGPERTYSSWISADRLYFPPVKTPPPPEGPRGPLALIHPQPDQHRAALQQLAQHGLAAMGIPLGPKLSLRLKGLTTVQAPDAREINKPYVAPTDIYNRGSIKLQSLPGALATMLIVLPSERLHDSAVANLERRHHDTANIRDRIEVAVSDLYPLPTTGHELHWGDVGNFRAVGYYVSGLDIALTGGYHAVMLRAGCSVTDKINPLVLGDRAIVQYDVVVDDSTTNAVDVTEAREPQPEGAMTLDRIPLTDESLHWTEAVYKRDASFGPNTHHRVHQYFYEDGLRLIPGERGPRTGKEPEAAIAALTLPAWGFHLSHPAAPPPNMPSPARALVISDLTGADRQMVNAAVRGGYEVTLVRALCRVRTSSRRYEPPITVDYYAFDDTDIEALAADEVATRADLPTGVPILVSGPASYHHLTREYLNEPNYDHASKSVVNELWEVTESLVMLAMCKRRAGSV